MSYDSHVNLHSRKRKHSNEPISSGKKFCPNQQTTNKTVPIPNAKQECSNRTNNQKHKSYSANDRLKKLRANLEANVSNRKDKCSSREQSSENLLKTVWRSSRETVKLKCDTVEPTTSTKDKCISSVNDDCAMDWCSLDDKEVLSKVQEVRKITCSQKTNPQVTFQSNASNRVTNPFDNKIILNKTYIVVDTNIFLSYLHIIKSILNIQVNGPTIYVPWMVIEELDYMKENKSDSKLKGAAITAIKFINKQLHTQNGRFKGQQVKDAVEQFSSKNPDDGILYCCLQMMKTDNQLMLLSNDVNLRNKALIHGITAYSHEEILPVLNAHKSRYQNDNLQSRYKETHSIESQIEVLFTTIISTQLDKAYGKALSGMHVKTPPWSLTECLNLFQRFWKPVFSCNLQKQFQHTINNFKTFLEEHRDISDCSTKDVNDLLHITFSMCVYLKNGLPEHAEKIKKFISEVQSITDGMT